MIVTNDTVWRAGSIINLTEQVQIAHGATLTIEAGAVVRGGSIQAFGNLLIEGTPDNRVILDDVSLTFSANHEIEGRIEVTFATFSGGAFLPATGNGSYGSFSVVDSVFSNVSGFYIWYPVSNSDFTRNSFNNSQGLSIGTDRDAQLIVEANSFIDSTRPYNGSGNAAIVNWVAYGDPVIVRNNTFSVAEGSIAIELPPRYTSTQVDARGNYWGTTSFEMIGSLVLDARDDLNRASAVLVGDPLGNPHPDAPAIPLILRGTVGDDALTGTDMNDTIYGFSGNDMLDGDAGDDSLMGGAGNDTLMGGAGNNTVFGGDGADVITAGSGDDFIGGGAGDDLITVLGGNNQIFGGLGSDRVNGGIGNDTVNGGGDTGNVLLGNGGDDLLYGSVGNDLIGGGEGNDLIFGVAGLNTIYTGLGNDTVQGGTGADDIFGAGTGTNQIFGNDGNDTIRAGDGGDLIGGGAGNDTLLGSVGNDTIYGGSGNDFIGGGAGNDLIYGSTGQNTIFTGFGNDTVQGGTGADNIFGSGDSASANELAGNDGNDTIRAGAGNDTIAGGAGDDQIFGGAGNNTIYLGLGNDFVGGGAGNDVIVAGAGTNQIFGGVGNDTVFAGFGRDVISGGPGADVFVFNSAAQAGIGAGRDVIADFEVGVDEINLDPLNLTFIGAAAFSGAAQLAYLVGGSTGFLVGDIDGDGAADFAIEVTGAPALTVDDLIL